MICFCFSLKKKKFDFHLKLQTLLKEFNNDKIKITIVNKKLLQIYVCLSIIINNSFIRFLIIIYLLSINTIPWTADPGLSRIEIVKQKQKRNSKTSNTIIIINNRAISISKKWTSLFIQKIGKTGAYV